MKTKRLTISDVAEAAGVSVTTVSDVLNGQDRVSSDTAEHVQAVIADIGYEPRPNRRRRRNLGQETRTRQIAFLVLDPDPLAAHTELMEQISGGIRKHLQAADYDLLVTSIRSDGTLPHCIAEQQVDGVILRPGPIGETQREQLAALPTVWAFNAPDQRFDFVAPDDELLAEMGIDHLRRRGCRTILIVNPDRRHPSFHTRHARAQFHAVRSGVDAESLVIAHDDRICDHLALIRQINPDGIFFVGFTHHNRPQDLVHELRLAGIKAALNDQLIGQNDTTQDMHRLSIRPRALGQSLAEQLLWRLQNTNAMPRRILLQPQLYTIDEPNNVPIS